MDTEKKLSPLKRFFLLIKPDEKEIRNVYVYAVFYGLVNLSLPIGIQAIINLIQGGQFSTSWVILVFFVILGLAITGVLQVFQLKITEHLQQKIFTRAAFEFTYRIPRIKLEELYNKYAPELMNRFFDIISIQKGLSKVLIDFSSASIQTIFGLLLLSLYHPFFIVFSLILVVLVYSIFKLTAQRGLETSLLESKSKYNMASWLEELARTAITFKLAGVTKLPMERTNEGTREYVDAREEHFKVLKFQYILLIVFKVLVASGLLIVGSILVIDQKMNIGQFVAAEIIILLVIGSVEKIILSLESIYDILTSLEKVGQVTDLELEPDEGMNIGTIMKEKGLDIEMQHVYFKYPGNTKYILKNASLNIEAGSSILVEGDGESGKTTLLYLLSGLYKIESGSLSINKIPFGNINPYLLRSTIGDCLMDELLFEGTLLENITMGREKANFENVQWAFNCVGLTSFAQSLPLGFDTQVKPEGKQFSKGIIEKLILARSIADKPKLLLIKDLFTSLSDTERENIFNFLVKKDNPWTLVIISRDPFVKDIVDKTILIENSTINELS
ncbi:ATP-binding cassette domain-containing protein [Flavobacteriales bacterium]|nr:ATP-binding cassette domain-containing protein [Flavobacteriales bacterium]